MSDVLERPPVDSTDHSPPPPDRMGTGTGGAAILIVVLVLGAIGVAGFALDISTQRERHRSDTFVVDKVSYCPGGFGCKAKTIIRTTDGSHRVIRGHGDVPGDGKAVAIMRDGYGHFVGVVVVDEGAE